MKAYVKIGSDYFLKEGMHRSIQPSFDQQYITNQCDFSHFSNENVHYIQCILKNKSLFECLDDYPRKRKLELLKEKMLAHYKSVTTIKMPLELAHKFIPPTILTHYHGELLDAMEYAFNAFERPADYWHLRCAWLIAEAIAKRPIRHDGKFKPIHYNAFPSTGYGRFGMRDTSFKILTCPREERKKIQPISDEFVIAEYDYNAFEIRTLVALCDLEQPPGDLYDLLHDKEKSSLTRSEFKQHTISCLYSNRPEKTPLIAIIRKRNLKERFPLVDGKLTNCFGKTMESDNFHYYSRLLQSSAAYILFQQVYKLISYINTFGLKSFVSFCIHDSVCMNVHKSELHLLKLFEEILSIVSIDSINYEGNFSMKLKVGDDYSKMEVVSL